MNMIRTQKVFLVSMILFWMASCSGISTTSTALPLESQTSFLTIQPTDTPVPTATQKPATPTVTPELSLQTSGPYFSYFREVDGIYQLVIMDADGSGRRVIILPRWIADALPNKENDLDMRFVSPDGKWLVFYTGFVDEMFGIQSGTKKYDLALNLLNLETGETQTITQLLSKDYPNNFNEASKKLNDPYINSADLQYAFVAGIMNSLAWSPDGRYLAFAGQMDGLSSDLYVYDMERKSIHRLSSGDQELQWINWSPDGKWIVHSSVYSVGEGMTFDVYAAAVDGSSVRYLSTDSLYSGVERWLNSHTYFENDSQNGPGNYGLRLVDINTGKVTKMWDGSYFSYEVDKDGKYLMVNAMLPDISPSLYSGSDPKFQPGPYLIDLTTRKKARIEFPSDGISPGYVAFPFGFGGQKFVLIGDNSKSYLLSDAGRLTPLDLQNAQISVSSNSNYWIAVVGQDVQIFSVDNSLISSIAIPVLDVKITDITWRPDSSGLFLIYDTNIYSLNLLDGKINLVETNLFHNYKGVSDYIWTNDQ